LAWVAHTTWQVVLVSVGAASGASGVTTAPTTQPAPFELPPPATAPAVIDEPGTREVRLYLPGREEPVSYWLCLPAGCGAGQEPPLLLALHGTNDTAREMIDFWAARKARVPMIIAAPQGIGPGWRSGDLATIRAMLEHLRVHVSYDRRRVLLAGFSAGGAMGLYLLYREQLEVTAVAALANYVPPSITADEVHARRHVPVFYAVGMADVNHERMRRGIQYLRSAGGNVDLYRPRLGHTLDAGVGQSALDWLFDQCARDVEAVIAGATPGGAVAESAVKLEGIIAQRRWHEPAHVERASAALARIKAPGRHDLDAARNLMAEGRGAEAVERLRQVEVAYAGSRLGREARAIRMQAEADPQVREALAERAARRRAEEALAMYAGAQRLVADGRFDEAADRCRRVIRLYGDTPGAERARYLLSILQPRSSP